MTSERFVAGLNETIANKKVEKQRGAHATSEIVRCGAKSTRPPPPRDEAAAAPASRPHSSCYHINYGGGAIIIITRYGYGLAALRVQLFQSVV